MFITPTYAEGAPPEDAYWFCKWLEDFANDFRVSKTHLNNVRYAVFGLGNSLYSDFYNQVGRNIDKWMNQLGAVQFVPLGLGDENVAASLNGSLEADFDHWSEGLLHLLKNRGKVIEEGGCGKGDNCCSKKKKKSVLKKIKNDGELADVTCDSDSEGELVMDLEDLGSYIKKEENLAKEEDEDGEELEELPVAGEREMLTPLLRDALTKQGYRLIGSHSGVKLCRWTKVSSCFVNVY